MLWLVGRLNVERKILILAACDCARLALSDLKDEHSLKSINITDRWANGDPTVSIEAVRAAAVCTAPAAAYAAALAIAESDILASAYAALVAATIRSPKVTIDFVEIVRKRIDESVIESLWNQMISKTQLVPNGGLR